MIHEMILAQLISWCKVAVMVHRKFDPISTRLQPGDRDRRLRETVLNGFLLVGNAATWLKPGGIRI
jgi:hypothetical protein